MGRADGAQGTFFWNLYGRFYDGINIAIPYRGLLYELYVQLDLKPGQKVLDAGCGTGNFEKFISERDIPPIEIEAIDFSEAMLARAKKKCKDLDFVNFVFADLNQELSYSDNTFDRIICINVLYALKNPDMTLNEFCRVLKPDGKIIIANPKPDAQFAMLIRDHFKRIGNIWGLSRKISAILKTFAMMTTTGLAPILLNIFLIERKGRKAEYHFLPKEEFLTIFERNNLQNIDVNPTYADQNWLAMATKVPPSTPKETLVIQ
jgi:ubiquinone/menaquinone biosynthesis C-methylase UbiE